MRPTTSRVVKDLAGRLRQGDRTHRPILFLGAGCSISAGFPGLPKLLEGLGAGTLEDLVRRQMDDITLRSQVAEHLRSPENTSAHDMLARLISEGYFDTVLTTNWDFLLERSLARVLLPDDYRVYVRPEVSDEQIATALGQDRPRVKIVKLHGDLLNRPLTDPRGLMSFKKVLEDRFSEKIRDKGIAIIGYSFEEPRFFRILEPTANVIVVNPTPLDSVKLQQYGQGAIQASGDDGRFDYFVEGLCCELLGRGYRALTENPPSGAEGAKRIFPPEEHRGDVDEICTRIRERNLLSNLDDGKRVKELTKALMQKIRDRFLDQIGEGRPGVCLVFIQDPSAPGGEEIRSLVESHEDMKKLTRGMDTQSVEIASRYGGDRRVKRWDRPGGGDDLSRYAAVILIDSVSFSGNTLELARSYLSEKGGRGKDGFTAALLLLPRETERRLTDKGWGDIVGVVKDYSGFEVTFPWGWTSATLPVRGGRRAHDFIPSDGFEYIPKPWGDQLTFAANEHASVSLLLLQRGQRTSSHYHLLRDETFVVLDNRLRVCLWDRYIGLRKHESIRIPAGVPHCLIALDQPCRVLEIATGHYDLQRDIVRLADINCRQPEAGSHNGLK